MPSLPQILLGRSWAERDQLRKALRHQQKVGGSLPTCLLETGALSEKRLLRALSEQFGVPWVDADALRHADRELARLLPRKLAEQSMAVPFHQVATALHVAMADPNDLAAQDELAFACGRRLHIHVSHPARIAEAQQRLYGVEPPSRLAALVDQLNRSRYLWQGEAGGSGGIGEGRNLRDEGDVLSLPDLPDPLDDLFERSREPRRTQPGTTGDTPPPAQRSPAPSSPPAEEGQAPTSSEQARRSTGTPPARPPSPPRSISLSPEERRQLYRRKEPTRGDEATARQPPEPLPAEPFAAAFQRLGMVRDRDEVAAIVLDLLASQFSRSALWVVRGQRIEGWRGRGANLDRERLRSTSIPLDQPSVFLNLASGTPFHLGPLPAFPTHREMLAAWQGPRPAACLVVPVRLHDRLVMALWGDRGEEPVGGLALHRFQTLAEHVANALERCIRLKKKHSRGAGRS